MNSYLTLPLTEAFLSFGLLALVAVKGTRRRGLRNLFLVFLATLGLWGILIFAMRSSPDIEHALFWERHLLPFSILISVLYFHFAVRYTGTRLGSWFIPGAYIFVAISFVLSSTSDLFVQGMQVKSYGYAPVLGPLILLPIAFSISLVITALVYFTQALRKSRDSDSRLRAFLIIMGGAISLVGMIFDILPALGLRLYPGFIIGNIIFCLLTSVAILKYKLLDINLVLRRGVAYFLTTSFFLFVVLMIWVLTMLYFKSFPVWAYIMIVAGLALSLPPVWCFFQHRVDRWFYRGRYDQLRALELFAQDTQSLADPATGIRIVTLLAQALQASNVHLLLARQPDGNLHASYTTARAPLPYISLDEHSPLVEWFAARGNLISREEFEVMPQFTSNEKRTLLKLEAELLAPVRNRSRQLSGLILVGKKLSEQRYNNEEKELLQAFATQMSTKFENIALYADAVQMEHELKGLSRRLVEVQEEERRNIARELHDEIGQSLALTKILLDTAVAVPKKAEPSLAQAQSIVREVIRQVREISLNLRPSILDDLGLLPALEWYLSQFTSRSRIQVDFEHEGLDNRLPGDVSTAAYRIVQEGLSNIVRHASTDRARLSVSGRSDGLHIVLQDYGKGFNMHEVNSNSTGLKGMRERVTMLHGRMQIDSAPGKGTRLLVELPLERKNVDGEHRAR